MLLKNAQVVGGIHIEELPFAGNLNGSHALLVGFGHHAAALARGKRAQLVKRPRGEEHGSARRVFKACAPDARGAVLSAAKKLSEAVRADERLIALDERGRVAARHLPHPQAYGVVSPRFAVQNDLDSQLIAQVRHVRVPRDHDASGEQALGCSQHVLDKRHTAELGHELVSPKAGAQTRCHDDASVVHLRSLGGVGHDGAPLQIRWLVRCVFGDVPCATV